jgi:hypothetical protein
MSDLVLAATDRPLPIRVSRIEDERVPEGMVGLATHLNERLIARCAVAGEVAEFIEGSELFQSPVQLVLAAREAPPGLQCQLYAVVSMPEAAPDDEKEPWAASVPGAGYQDAEEEQAEEATGQQMVFLGQIVRVDRDRRHRNNLALEAADVLRKLVEGATSEVVDRVLEDLLGGGSVP